MCFKCFFVLKFNVQRDTLSLNNCFLNFPLLTLPQSSSLCSLFCPHIVPSPVIFLTKSLSRGTAAAQHTHSHACTETQNHTGVALQNKTVFLDHLSAQTRTRSSRGLSGVSVGRRGVTCEFESQCRIPLCVTMTPTHPLCFNSSLTALPLTHRLSFPPCPDGFGEDVHHGNWLRCQHRRG